jgi:hypothetical protein
VAVEPAATGGWPFRQPCLVVLYVASLHVGGGHDGVVSVEHEAGELAGNGLMAASGPRAQAQADLFDVAGHRVRQHRGDRPDLGPLGCPLRGLVHDALSGELVGDAGVEERGFEAEHGRAQRPQRTMAKTFRGGAQRCPGAVEILVGEILRRPTAHRAGLGERGPLEPGGIEAEPHGDGGDVEAGEELCVASGLDAAEQWSMGDHVVGGGNQALGADEPSHEPTDLHVDVELILQRHRLPPGDVSEADEEGPGSPDVGVVAPQPGGVQSGAIRGDDLILGGRELERSALALPSRRRPEGLCGLDRTHSSPPIASASMASMALVYSPVNQSLDRCR